MVLHVIPVVVDFSLGWLLGCLCDLVSWLSIVLGLCKIPAKLSIFCCRLFLVGYVSISRSCWYSVSAISCWVSDFPTDLAYQLGVVLGFVGLLLLAVVVRLLRTLLGLGVDPIGLVLESFTAINPLVPQDVTISAIAFKPSFGFFRGVRLVSSVVVGGWLGILLFGLVVEFLVQWLHGRGAGEQLSVLATALHELLYFLHGGVMFACHGQFILELDRELCKQE